MMEFEISCSDMEHEHMLNNAYEKALNFYQSKGVVVYNEGITICNEDCIPQQMIIKMNNTSEDFKKYIYSRFGLDDDFSLTEDGYFKFYYRAALFYVPCYMNANNFYSIVSTIDKSCFLEKFIISASNEQYPTSNEQHLEWNSDPNESIIIENIEFAQSLCDIINKLFGNDRVRIRKIVLLKKYDTRSGLDLLDS